MINYKITKFDEKDGIYSIRIESLSNPVYVKYIFTTSESATKESRTDTIERLLAALEIKDGEYIVPIVGTDRLNDLPTYTIKPEKVEEQKILILIEKSR